jgi:hypothetical protein
MTSPENPGRDGDPQSSRPDLDDQALENRLRIRTELAVTSPSVVIDPGEVAFCDSTGLGALVAIWTGIAGTGAGLAEPASPAVGPPRR